MSSDSHRSAGEGLSGKRILLIEDDRLDATVLVAQLAPATVTWASSFAEGLQLLRTATFDAVGLDLHLPDSTPEGSVVRIVDVVPARTPVVVLTGLDDTAVATELVGLGADDYVQKFETSAAGLRRKFAVAIERARLRSELLRQREELAEWARSGELEWDWWPDDGRIVFGPAWIEAFGGEQDGSVRQWVTHVHPDDRAKVSGKLADFVARGASGGEFRCRMQTLGREYRWYSVRLAATLEPWSGRWRVLGSHTDVTDACTNPCTRCGHDNRVGVTECANCRQPLARRRPVHSGDTLTLAPEHTRVVADRYRIERNIGSGGAGSVYLATDTETETPVAIKLLHPWLVAAQEARRRFLLEGHTQATLHHPNIVTVLDVGRDQSHFFLVTEFVDGGSLSDFLARRGRLPFAEACALLLPVMDAITYAHGRGVVHRDVKPSNILIAGSPDARVAKLTDFGVAKVTPRSSDTETGAVVGTLKYIPPEQLQDAKHVDGRADVYSLAATFYEAVYGEAPDPPRLRPEGLTCPSRVNPDFPPVATSVLSRAMSHDPADRHSTGAELAAALRDVLRRGARRDGSRS